MVRKTWEGWIILPHQGAQDNGLVEHGQFPVSPSLKYLTNWNPQNQLARPFVLGLVADLEQHSPCNRPNTWFVLLLTLSSAIKINMKKCQQGKAT